MLVHKHVIIRTEINNPLKSEADGIIWILGLIDEIAMELCAGPIAKYVDMPGNRGLTVAAIIETSHIVAHFWDEPDPKNRVNNTVSLAQIDIYSCGELFLNSIFENLKQFDPVKMEYKFLDREKSLIEIEG